MKIDDIVELFNDKPFKMTSVHRSVILRMISVCRAAEDWAEDSDDEEFTETLTDAITDLLEYDE